MVSYGFLVALSWFPDGFLRKIKQNQARQLKNSENHSKTIKKHTQTKKTEVRPNKAKPDS